MGDNRGVPSAAGSGSGAGADAGIDKDSASDVPVLAASLDAALESAHAADANRVFVIGGAELYAAALPLAERVLLTRIIEPSFEGCDVFMPDFVGGEGGGKWRRAPHDALSSWVGFEVAKGVQEEGVVKYEFEMWTRELIVHEGGGRD
jgi:dihydrofolate reductase